jgi:hypothetical protein
MPVEPDQRERVRDLLKADGRSYAQDAGILVAGQLLADLLSPDDQQARLAAAFVRVSLTRNTSTVNQATDD